MAVKDGTTERKDPRMSAGGEAAGADRGVQALRKSD